MKRIILMLMILVSIFAMGKTTTKGSKTRKKTTVKRVIKKKTNKKKRYTKAKKTKTKRVTKVSSKLSKEVQAELNKYKGKTNNHSLQGIASNYGGRLHGGPTASGERFNQYAMTAAHKTLPMGTKVRVTNPANGKSIVVKINDRGPYIKGRVIDLSRGAFQQIAPLKQGIIKNVIIEVLEWGNQKYKKQY